MADKPSAKRKEPPIGSPAWHLQLREQKAKEGKKTANKKRNARKKSRKNNGPQYPYCVRLWANADKAMISLTQWREMKKVAITEMLLNMKDDEIVQNVVIRESKFVEAPAGFGIKTGEKPSETRMGHGIVFMSNEISRDFVEQFFANVACTNPMGPQFKPYTSKETADPRAVYTTVVDNTIWNVCTAHDIIWKLARSKYPDLPQTTPFVRSAKALSHNAEDICVTILFAPDWEDAIEKRKRLLELPIGVLKFRRRCPGAPWNRALFKTPTGGENDPAATTEPEEEILPKQ
jgi:hypothetical protein